MRQIYRPLVSMIRIGILSDTHLPGTTDAAAFLRQVVEQHFQRVEMILHAGDIVAPAVLAALAPCPVFGVRGNMDAAAPELPHRRVIHVGGVNIGLIHGWGFPEGLAERVRGEFADTALDCLVFGHSHEPVCRREGDLLLFNPGSATDRRTMPGESVGMLEVDGGRVSGRIIPLGEALSR
jgi:putative phosphoesterase